MPENSPPTLPPPADSPHLMHGLSSAYKAVGSSTVIADDILKTPLTYQAFYWRTSLLARALQAPLAGTSYVGLMLPTSTGAALSFFALHQIGRVPVMLNFSAGEQALKAAVEMIPLTHIITSRAFVEKGGLEPVVAFLSTMTKIIYLEDVRQTIGKIPALLSLAKLKCVGTSGQTTSHASASDPAVVLFTSGSEGLPKGVVLSHANLLSNIAQVKSVLKFHPSDVMFNALPAFHSFGLVVGTILPVLLGIRVFFYPNPLHYKQIPKLCRENGATILLGTDTFLKGYAATTGDGDFKTLRLVVAGAERLKESTAETYRSRFGIEILQGYGVTETSPVLCCNAPDANRPGTVGRLMPGIEAKITPVDGISDGGLLHVKGPNIMSGYIKHDKPGILQPAGEWHDTGDVVTIDAGGYLRIVGRVKRFAKIGGEMVSLAAVEELAQQCSPERAHAAVSLADEKKGEQIILCTEDAALTREALIKQLSAAGLSELCLPKKLVYMETLPRLGNGKLDYPAIGKQAAVN